MRLELISAVRIASAADQPHHPAQVRQRIHQASKIRIFRPPGAAFAVAGIGGAVGLAAILALGVTKRGWRSVAARTSVRRVLIIWIVAPLLSLALSYGLTAAADRLGLL